MMAATLREMYNLIDVHFLKFNLLLLQFKIFNGELNQLENYKKSAPYLQQVLKIVR